MHQAYGLVSLRRARVSGAKQSGYVPYFFSYIRSFCTLCLTSFPSCSALPRIYFRKICVRPRGERPSDAAARDSVRKELSLERLYDARDDGNDQVDIT